MERHLVASAIASRQDWETLVTRGIEAELSPSGEILFEGIKRYYERDTNAQRADLDLLAEWLLQSYPRHAVQMAQVLRDLPEASSNSIELWLSAKRQAVGHRLATALIDNKVEDIDGLLEEYEFFKNYEEEIPRTFCGASATELLQEDVERGLVPVYPKSLNDALGGGVGRGAHIVVFGRPNAGKTQFLINALAVMVQRGLRVLYLGNEDRPKKVLLRIISRLADMDMGDVKMDPTGSFDKAVAAGYNNVIFHQMIPGTVGEIRSTVEKHKPDVVIVDQLRNIYMKDSNLTQVLEKGAIQMRNIGNKHNCVVISVTQAGESGHNKVMLDYNDVEYSNTGLAATADVMIGVGVDERLYAEHKIMLNVCKNKETDAHPALPVRVNRLRSKLKSEV